ncbi:DUF1294 domain-containing protein [Cytobacillus sp. IB215665]|uniref:DUF1294 domain-containing protein n=1 Tax=Cytobacillus sp. IB215665 TaxID=3097357 RepID=UPI002A12017A|nr:DUF1294 domain-containing protein [Cytobacillus sp. IB215665]MDX8363976.1 DUF1294 domain-containing protein [Cytobacillus sp. IB215665]
MKEVFLLLYVIINLVGYVVMYIDKRKAKQQKWRISEKSLWYTAFVGGAFGLWIGMYHHRHKTKHKIFTIGLPIVAMAQILIFTSILVVLS